MKESGCQNACKDGSERVGVNVYMDGLQRVE